MTEPSGVDSTSVKTPLGPFSSQKPVRELQVGPGFQSTYEERGLQTRDTPSDC